MILSCIFFAIEGLPKINQTSENVMSKLYSKALYFYLHGLP